uniref:Uncharacterized protein n=1 Tax=viral metagenome TaxID=1070528 RepID=A0A6M3JHG4_9ZZZZ
MGGFNTEVDLNWEYLAEEIGRQIFVWDVAGFFHTMLEEVENQKGIKKKEKKYIAQLHNAIDSVGGH